MLVFVIPLKSPKVSSSWERVCHLFERCIQSVCSQTSPDFRAVVVCNEKPSIQFSHPHIHYLEVDLPVPGAEYRAREMDKGRKIILGLTYAQKFAPNHTMIVDADDCVSQHIADFTNKNPQTNGWFLNRGYVYEEGSNFIYLRRSAFHKWCGTCNILRYDLNKLPTNLEDYPPELNTYYSNHKHLEETMAKAGTPLSALPFPGCVYIVGNGENIYQQGFSTIHKLNRNKVLFRLKDALNYRLLTRSVRSQFSLYDIAA